MNRKLMIVAAAGLVSFAGAFVTGWFTRPKAAHGSARPAGAGTAEQTGASTRTSPTVLVPALAATADDGTAARSMTEQQLKELMYEIREKIREYDRKLQDLEKEKERMQSAQQTLRKNVEALNTLRVDLAASVANLKNERDILLKTRVQIEQAEKSTLQAIAAAYDKMDAARAGEILKSMAHGQTTGKSAQADDAVRILHYMQDRTKAKVLAELAATEPALAAALSQKLKQVMETK